MLEANTLDEPVKTTRVAWCGETEWLVQGALPPGCELFQVAELIGAGAAFDSVVLDVRAFENLDQLYYRYAALGVPAVLVVDALEQETAALAWLRSGDEICRREALAQQIGLRLRRCLQTGNAARGGHLDSLTGVADRRGFHECAKTLFAANDAGEPLCLVLLNLDGFKRINDRWGHDAGDHLLQEVGHLLQRYALGAGLVARLSGDGFAILLHGDLEQGAALAEFLRDQLATHPFTFQTAPISVTASFGVVARNGSTPIEILLQEADRCLYAAKEQGCNRVVTAEEFDALADANGQDAPITDFENRIRVLAARMTGALVLKARQLASQYRIEADRDGLTGAFNRRYLDRLLPRELDKARRHDRRLTVALLDLDHFGAINKTYGFPTGDRALRAAVAILQAGVRAGDWVARYGGEEFCAVMPDTDLAAGCQVAERIRAALSAEIVNAYDRRSFRVTASIGVVELDPEDIDSVALFQRASDRVREAKQDGRNQVRS
ncbi:MAG TPA: GGDEF domain-containing protein [Candidatus Competibacter sp.]|nr:GGDEF domain-containing protein [Candidatus Competibacter sp.]